VAAFLLAVFLVAVSITLARGLDISCGCFNTGEARKIGFRLLAEDLVLFAASCVLILKARDSIGWRALIGLGDRR
jgi:hypothetical protein